MDIISVSSETSRISKQHILILNLSNKIEFQRGKCWLILTFTICGKI